MGRYRKIEVRMWNDRKFRSLGDSAKLAFILLLTHPDTNQLGFIRARPVSLACDLGWHPNAMSDAIQTLSQLGMVMSDEEAGLMYIPNFLKHNPPNGANGAKSWKGLIDLLPECDLLDQGLLLMKPIIESYSDGIRDAIPNDIRNAIANAIKNANPQASRIQEQEQEQEKEQEQEYTHNKEGNTLVMEEPSFEPPVCYEDSLKTQIEKSSALTSAFNPIKFLSDEDVLDETQLVVAIKQFCKPCARNERTKALVATQTITLRAVRRACEIAKNAGKANPGYVIGILDNYAKDPDESFFQELNEDGIDEAEIARLFAKKEGK